MILVVEDEPDLAVTCARLLRRRGHGVITASSREAALVVLRAEAKPALLVCDVSLPDGDGLDVVRVAHAMQPRVPAVVMTGRASEPGRLAARAAGAARYLPKPFAVEAFATAVDEVIAGG